MDEPTRGLSPSQSDSVPANIIAATETAIVVTQNHEQLHQSDRIILLEHGEVALDSAIGGLTCNSHYKKWNGELEKEKQPYCKGDVEFRKK